MAFTLESTTNRVITLEEYIDHVRRRVDVYDLASISESADLLKALANNRSFVTEHINNELRQWRNFQVQNTYTAQTLLLGSGPNFLVRANIWVPPAQNAQGRQDQKHLFYYQVPHDHNFSFLTIGYFGPGYETTIYEYDPDSIAGAVGEHVALRYLETTSLPEGKIMLYRASHDVHSQEHPQEFSISLNLLLAPPETNLANQYLFDLDSCTIRDYVKTAGTSRIMLCRIARHVGDGTTINVLESLAARHPSERVRATAYESWAALDAGSRERIWAQASDDSHTLVKRLADADLRRP
jgi:hypothetical protein